MATLDLLFRTDDRAPLELVFGDDPDAGAAPEYTLSGGGQITGLQRSSAELSYDINVQRPLLALRRSDWQDGQPVSQSVRSGWQDAAQLTVATRVVNEPGQPISRVVRSAWQDSRPLTVVARAVQQRGKPLSSITRAAFEQARVLSIAARSRFEPGLPILASARSGFQQTQQLAAAVRSSFQLGVHLVAAAHASMQPGRPLLPVWRPRFQQARYPLPGGLPPIPEPPGRDDWCYVPVDPIELLFQPDARAPLELLFECDRHGPGPSPGPIIIPVRACYVVQNEVTLYRLPSGVEFLASSFSLDIDADSWTFSWSASLHHSAKQHLVRSTPSERVEVECVVNGQHLRLSIDNIGRDRRLPEERIAVRGRGRAAALADVDMSFGNTVDRTAQQLMQDVLTVNGVSIGWSLDWQITDWFVPANTWVFRGSYITALQDIAGAAGAYLQPHLTDQVLRVLPRYPLAPWHWAASLTPDIVLPIEVTSVENIEEVIRPDYNQVHVGGIKAPAVFGPVTRAGTAGDKEAQQVVHSLITASQAHLQRGLAELSDTGLQEHVTVQTMLLPETGIIMPGTVISYVSDDRTRLGIVRKTGLQMDQWPELLQNLGVETHVD